MFCMIMLNIRNFGLLSLFDSQISDIYHVHGCVSIVEKSRQTKAALEYYNR